MSGLNDSTLFELRQQLSCQSKEILELAIHHEIDRLNKLRNEIIRIAGRSISEQNSLLEKVDLMVKNAEIARNELMYVYVDQFELGRLENDRAGHIGLNNN